MIPLLLASLVDRIDCMGATGHVVVVTSSNASGFSHGPYRITKQVFTMSGKALGHATGKTLPGYGHLDNVSRNSVTISPNGRCIAIDVITRGRNGLSVFDTRTWREVFRWEHPSIAGSVWSPDSTKIAVLSEQALSEREHPCRDVYEADLASKHVVQIYRGVSGALYAADGQLVAWRGISAQSKGLAMLQPKRVTGATQSLAKRLSVLLGKYAMKSETPTLPFFVGGMDGEYNRLYISPNGQRLLATHGFVAKVLMREHSPEMTQWAVFGDIWVDMAGARQIPRHNVGEVLAVSWPGNENGAIVLDTGIYRSLEAGAIALTTISGTRGSRPASVPLSLGVPQGTCSFALWPVSKGARR